MVLRRTARRLQQQQQRANANAGRPAGATAASVSRSLVPPYTKTQISDLATTKLDLGSGALGDPFIRSQPNLASRAPESTTFEQQSRASGDRVLASAIVNGTAHNTRLSLGEWLAPTGERPCPLIVYLQSLQDPDALPLPRGAQQRIKHFETVVLPQSYHQRGMDAAMGLAQWKSSVTAMRNIASEPTVLFEGPDALKARLDTASRALTAFVNDGGEGADIISSLTEVTDILRRDAILQRNAALQQLIDFASSAPFTGGQAVWDRFFSLVKQYEEELLQSNDAAHAQWEVTQEAPLPSVKPSTALLFLCVAASNSGASASAKPAALLDGSIPSLAQHLSQDEVAEFALPCIDAILEKPRLEVFHRLQLVEAYRTLSSIVASVQTRRDARRIALKDVAAELHNVEEAKTLLQHLYNSGDPELMRTAVRIGQPPTNGNTVSFNLMDSKRWASICHSAVFELLLNPKVTQRIFQMIGGLSGDESKKKRKGFFNETSLKILTKVHDEELADTEVARVKVGELRLALLQSDDKQTILQLLADHGVDMSLLQKRVSTTLALKHKPAVAPASSVYSRILAEVMKRHPAWVKDAIVSDRDAQSEPSGAAAVAMLLRVYLRSTYVPTNAKARMAHRHRGRIGPLATHPEETNIETEFGFAEHYDVLEYKKYDWQGWYQRMVDVQNRNVSVRCKLSNLRVLDSNGKPLINLQSERRLRVLAGERVGSGIIKLDSDRFEDAEDNATYGAVKLSELLSDAKKTDLGPEYWPSVEVKVKRPSGQSRMQYSMLDWDRVEAQSKEAFERYSVAKAKQLFVPPTATWLQTSGQRGGSQSTASATTSDGYSEEALFDTLGGQ